MYEHEAMCCVAAGLLLQQAVLSAGRCMPHVCSVLGARFFNVCTPIYDRNPIFIFVVRGERVVASRALGVSAFLA